MSASVNDKFRQASGSTRPVVTSLAAPKANGATTASLTAATGWNTTTGLDYVMYRRELNTTTGLYEETAGTRVEGRATLVGTTLSNMTFDAGTEPAAGYAADGNTVVLCAMTAQCWDDAVDGILAQHTQTGAHGNVTATGMTITGNLSVTGTVTGITPAKFQDPYKFRVYRSSAYNTAASTLTAFPFDTKTSTQGFDTGTNIDVVTNKGRFTAPIAGFYFFTGRFSVTTTRAFATLSVNSTEANRGHDMTVASGEVSGVVQGLLQLAANDYVEMYYFTATATAISTGSALAYFSGHLVSAT